MRILLSRSSTNQVVGGAELSARDIARCLIKQGHDVLLITNIKRSEMKKGLRPQNIRYSLWPRSSDSRFSKVFYAPKLFLLFLHYLFVAIRFKPDIICPQSREDQIILTLISRLLNKPVVWRDPGDLFFHLSRKPTSIFKKLSKQQYISCLLKASAVFTLNAEDKETIQKTVPSLNPTHISVIKSNILFEDYDVETKLSNREPKIIGTISQLEKHKGIDVLIEAFKKLVDSTPNNKFELQIVSNGTAKKELEQLSEGYPVKFLGFKENISGWLNDVDIYAQPSLVEGWGRTVKEARLFGKPIVASKVGGIQKQIQDGSTGLFCKPGDVDDLFLKLKQLVDDPRLRTKLQKGARESALKEGDWNTTVSESILPLFEKTI